MASRIHTDLDEDTATTHNPTPSPGSTSDKENQQRSVNKRNTAAMAPHNKRRRLANRPTNVQSVQSMAPAQSQNSSQRTSDTRWYDPDQDPAERQRIRKETRDLNREVNGMCIVWIFQNKEKRLL